MSKTKVFGITVAALAIVFAGLLAGGVIHTNAQVGTGTLRCYFSQPSQPTLFASDSSYTSSPYLIGAPITLGWGSNFIINPTTIPRWTTSGSATLSGGSLSNVSVSPSGNYTAPGGRPVDAPTTYTLNVTSEGQAATCSVSVAPSTCVDGTVTAVGGGGGAACFKCQNNMVVQSACPSTPLPPAPPAASSTPPVSCTASSTTIRFYAPAAPNVAAGNYYIGYGTILFGGQLQWADSGHRYLIMWSADGKGFLRADTVTGAVDIHIAIGYNGGCLNSDFVPADSNIYAVGDHNTTAYAVNKASNGDILITPGPVRMIYGGAGCPIPNGELPHPEAGQLRYSNPMGGPSVFLKDGDPEVGVAFPPAVGWTIGFDGAASSDNRHFIITGPSAGGTCNTSCTASAPGAKLSIGDRVQVTAGAKLNVRAQPSLNSAILGTMSGGSLGTVLGGPVSANSYTWWNIKYDPGAAAIVSGWSADISLTKVCASSSSTTSEAAPPTGIVSCFDKYPHDAALRTLCQQIETIKAQACASNSSLSFCAVSGSSHTPSPSSTPAPPSPPPAIDFNKLSYPPGPHGIMYASLHFSAAGYVSYLDCLIANPVNGVNFCPEGDPYGYPGLLSDDPRTFMASARSSFPDPPFVWQLPMYVRDILANTPRPGWSYDSLTPAEKAIYDDEIVKISQDPGWQYDCGKDLGTWMRQIVATQKGLPITPFVSTHACPVIR